jgi:hypothetical protein
MLQGKGQYFQPDENGGEYCALHGCCMEGPMALWWGEFPWGVPRPYARQPRTFLAACVDEAREQREDPWDPARLHREWVEQKLNAIQELVEARARSEGSFVVIQSKREHIAAVLREEHPPHGIPRRGKGWDKGAKETLKARGIDTSRAEYSRAVALNKRLAKSLSPVTM